MTVGSVYLTYEALRPVPNPRVFTAPACTPSNVTVLMAQAVPSATAVPCLDPLPAGWSFRDADIHLGQARFWLHSDRAGDSAVVVTLTHTCAESEGDLAPGNTSEVRTERIPGGCVTYEYASRVPTGSELRTDVDAALHLLERERLVAYVRAEDDLTLCGAGTTCVS